MNKMQATAMWNQGGYNFDSGIQTAAPSVKGYDDDDLSSHHSFQQFEQQQQQQWDNSMTGDSMDTAMNDQFNNTRRFVYIFNVSLLYFPKKSQIIN